MSQNNYRLQIVIDDSAVKKLQQRIENIMGIKTSGGSTSQSSGGGGLGAIGKIAAIGAGIAGLVVVVQKILDMVVGASPVLQAILGILNNAIMFMLRPIGDFIGFLLRPIVIYFLRYVAIPFYKHFAPFMQQWGTRIGTLIVKLLEWVNKALKPVETAAKYADAITTGQTIPGLRRSESKIILDTLKTANKIFNPDKGNSIFGVPPVLGVNTDVQTTPGLSGLTTANFIIKAEANVKEILKQIEPQLHKWFQDLYHKGVR